MMNWPHNNIVEEDLLQTKDEDEPVQIIEAKNELDIDINEHHHEPLAEEEEKQLEKQFDEANPNNWGIEDVDIPETEVIAVKDVKTELLLVEPGKNKSVSQALSSQMAVHHVILALNLSFFLVLSMK